MIHNMKLWPDSFEAIKNKTKTNQIRRFKKMKLKKLTVAALIAMGISATAVSTTMAACPCKSDFDNKHLKAPCEKVSKKCDKCHKEKSKCKSCKSYCKS